MARHEKRPAWFKVFASCKPTVDAVPDGSAGRAFKAALSYFLNQEEPMLDDPLAAVVFCAVRPYIDEAFEDYAASVEAGRRGAGSRWGHSGE